MTGVQTCALPIYDTATTELYTTHNTLSLHDALPISTGEVRGVVEVPTATDVTGRDPVAGAPDCTSTATDPADDVAAFLTGFAALAEVSVTP